MTKKTDDQIIDLALTILANRIKHPGEGITSPEDAKRYAMLQLGTREDEYFAVMFLSARHTVITYEELFRGTIDSANVHPRVVARRALELNAAAVILIHNHPSGKTDPSAADRRITEHLRTALALFDIKTLDHLIVGGTQVYSFSEYGLL